MKNWQKILLAAIGVILLLFILCYFFDFPFPVFCCVFHNWFNSAVVPLQEDWICIQDDGGGFEQLPPTYTCSLHEYPDCSGTCPPDQHCTAYYNIITQEDGCTCEPDTYEPPPEQAECSDTDGYADIFTYGECTDSTGTSIDFCIYAQTTVREYWCEDGYCMFDNYKCGTGEEFGCVFGKCVNCNVDCLAAGEDLGGYFSGGISCDDFEHYIVNSQCCCYSKHTP